MAEGLFRALAGDRLDVHSAGLEPKGVHPLAIRAMDEIGLDIRGQRSEVLDAYRDGREIDHLITVCDNAAERCPAAWPGVGERLHWPVDDPAAVEGSEEVRLEAFRHARDELRGRIEAWLAAMSRAGASGRDDQPAEGRSQA
jgi:arsenate reductase